MLIWKQPSNNIVHYHRIISFILRKYFDNLMAKCFVGVRPELVLIVIPSLFNLYINII